MNKSDNRLTHDTGIKPSDNSGGNKEPNMRTTTGCATAIPMGDGFWQIQSDETDLLLRKDHNDGKVDILFNDTCLSAAWNGVRSKLMDSAMDSWMPDHVVQALCRYERIMWLSRPNLLLEEAKLISYALFNNQYRIDLIKVGLKEQVYMSLSECELNCPDLYKTCGADKPKLLAKIEAMSPTEIFSLVHSAEAFSCGDRSDKSIERYYNIESSQDANLVQETGCGIQEDRP